MKISIVSKSFVGAGLKPAPTFFGNIKTCRVYH